MNCRIADMRHKEVINTKDGTRIGYVCDVEIDTVTARVLSLVIYGRLRFLACSAVRMILLSNGRILK